MQFKRIKRIVSLMIIVSLLTACSNKNDRNQSTKEYYEGYKVTQYNDATGNQATFYTITTYDGKLIVIDGGWVANETQVRQVIADNGNVVDAWIITHPHQDHCGAFNQIYANLDGITVKQIYDSPIDYNMVVKVGEKWDDIGIFDTYREITKDSTNITHLYRGDTFDLLGLNIEVINSYDQKVVDNSIDLSNDGALILKISSANKSILMCSDVKWMEDVIVEQFGDELQCDYIQVAHHGNWAFENAFYDLVQAKIAFFDAPAWIMTDPVYPAYDLANYMRSQGTTIYDFTTVPNSVYLD